MSAIPVEFLETVLKKVQKLDPPGVGARDLRECLLIQYAESGEKDEIFEDMVNNHFDLFKRMDLKEIAKKTAYSVEEIKAVFEKIKSFDPKPGRNYESDQPIYVVPDVHVVKGEDGFEVFLNDEGVPDLKMNRYYVGAFRQRQGERGHQGVYQEEDQAGGMVHEEPAAEAEDPLPGGEEHRRFPERVFREGHPLPEAPHIEGRGQLRGRSRIDGEPDNEQQVHGHPLRRLRDEVFLHHGCGQRERRRCPVGERGNGLHLRDRREGGQDAAR